ncbi:MAG: hypothetical protein Q4D56_09075 [Bacteroides sp.]|nr:hypothetical protein [Bacteroides sp.]
MGIISFVKKWTLPCAMLFGATIYTVFTLVKPLEPLGEAVAPLYTKCIAGGYFPDALCDIL